MVLDAYWLRRFEAGLYAFSYEELADTLRWVTLDRVHARYGPEVRIDADLSVHVTSSPRLRLAPEADEESRRWVARLEEALSERDAVILRIAKVAADAQSAFLTGDAPAPEPLPLRELAVRAQVRMSVAEAVLQNKYVRTPRGTMRLADLVLPWGPRPR